MTELRDFAVLLTTPPTSAFDLLQTRRMAPRAGNYRSLRFALMSAVRRGCVKTLHFEICTGRSVTGNASTRLCSEKRMTDLVSF